MPAKELQTAAQSERYYLFETLSTELRLCGLRDAVKIQINCSELQFVVWLHMPRECCSPFSLQTLRHILSVFKLT